MQSKKLPLKQRLRLIVEHYAQIQTGGEPLLSQREMEQLKSTFKTKEEIRAYNSISNKDSTLHACIGYLGQFRLSYRETIAYITGYVNLWIVYEETEKIINLLLQNIPELKVRKVLIKEVVKKRLLVAKMAKAKEEDIVLIVTNKTDGLEDILKSYTDLAVTNIAQTKAIYKATTDWMRRIDYTAKPYLKILDGYMVDIEKSWSIAPKYSRREFIKTLPATLSDEEKEKLIATNSKYFVYPDAEDIAPDEDFYRQFNNQFFSEYE